MGFETEILKFEICNLVTGAYSNVYAFIFQVFYVAIKRESIFIINVTVFIWKTEKYSCGVEIEIPCTISGFIYCIQYLGLLCSMYFVSENNI